MMSRNPGPLTFYENIVFLSLSAIALGLISYASFFYIDQLIQARGNPANSIHVLVPEDGLVIPDVFLMWANPNYNFDDIRADCMLYRSGYDDTPCPAYTRGITNMTFYGKTNPYIGTIHWLHYHTDALLKFNGIDAIYFRFNITRLQYEEADLNIFLYQPSDEKASFVDALTKSTSFALNLGSLSYITYTLNLFKPLQKDSYYTTTSYYGGSVPYHDDISYAWVNISPNTPYMMVNSEFVPIGLFNVISSIWSVVTLCVLIVTYFFPREVPKIHRYFLFRDEMIDCFYRQENSSEQALNYTEIV